MSIPSVNRMLVIVGLFLCPRPDLLLLHVLDEHSPGAPSSPITYSPAAHPQRNRRRPRHFDSSHDLDAPRRCKARNHIPLKSIRDFMDTVGRLRLACNECRTHLLERRPATPTPLINSSDHELESRPPPPDSLMQQRFDMILC